MDQQSSRGQCGQSTLAIKPIITLFLPPFLAIVSVLVLIMLQWGPETVARDFTAFYAAGKMLIECPESLYDAQSQLRYQKELGLGPTYLPFPYPALVPVIFVPFNWVSLSKAYWLMLGANLGLLFFCLLLMIRRYNLKPDQARLLLMVASTAFPIYTNLVAGQFAFVVLVLIVLFFADLKEDRARAGIWAGALVLKPSLLAVPLLILALNRNKRALIAAGATVGGIIAFSALLVGWKAMTDQAALLIAMGNHPAALANLHFMHNLRALSHWLQLGDAGGMILSGLVAVSLSFVPPMKRHSPQFRMAALIALALVSPHLHTYDLTILLPLVAFGIPTGVWYQRAYLLGPLAVLLLTYQIGAVPIIPIVLLALFVLSIVKARRWASPPLLADKTPEYCEALSGGRTE